jgi:hypothetical protein
MDLEPLRLAFWVSNGSGRRCSCDKELGRGEKEMSRRALAKVASEPILDRYNRFLHTKGTARSTTGHHVDTPVERLAQSPRIQIKYSSWIQTMPASGICPPHCCMGCPCAFAMDIHNRQEPLQSLHCHVLPSTWSPSPCLLSL